MQFSLALAHCFVPLADYKDVAPIVHSINSFYFKTYEDKILLKILSLLSLAIERNKEPSLSYIKVGTQLQWWM